jgi:hypothetical protein
VAIIAEERQLHGVDTEFDELLALNEAFIPFYELGVWVHDVTTAKDRWANSKLRDIDADEVQETIAKSRRALG